MTELKQVLDNMGRAARSSSRVLARSTSEDREAAIRNAAGKIRERREQILEANARDVERARSRSMSAAMLDRLTLDTSRIDAISAGLDAIADLPDPLGVIDDERQRPNGLLIQRVRVPLGVIGIIYESRPNVTADAAAICLKSGNAVILRGGSDSLDSSRELHRCLAMGLKSASLPEACVQWIDSADRAAVGHMLGSMTEWIDVIVPRGGRSLVERVAEEARVPVIGHLEGLCHVYLHAAADVDKAVRLTRNAKMRRTGVCGAAETLLVDESVLGQLLPTVAASLVEAGCELRGDEAVRTVVAEALPVSEDDWRTEYLSATLSVRAVDGIDAALAHIAEYGSGHTDCIVTEDAQAADRFLAEVDSAIVMHNASTQFADGGEFGMGAEIGIATGRLHARGPVGAAELTTYKYRVRGNGQTRD